MKMINAANDMPPIPLATIPSKSNIPEQYWIWAHDPAQRTQNAPNPGKWLIFVSSVDADAAWRKIELAVVAGLLGPSAKISTVWNALQKQEKSNKKSLSHVICVYTSDCEDAPDVMRVRQELTNLGWTKKLYYKADHQTHAGNYGAGTTSYSA